MTNESRPKSSIMEIILAIASIGAICLYVATIFIQFGYNSYFNIPSEFISFSIRENTLFFRIFTQGLLLFLASIRWYLWMLIGILVALSFWSPKIRKVVYLALIAFAAVFLWRTVSLGELVAKDQSAYFMLADDCTAMGTTTKYFIPNFYNEKALLVPYTKNQNSQNIMGSGFIVKDLSQLPCTVVYNYQFGKIEK